MVTRYDVDAVVSNTREQLEAMSKGAVSEVGKSAYRANEAYVEFIRWTCTECNKLSEGDNAADLLRAGAMVIAQQMIGMANMVTSTEKASVATSFMFSEVSEFLEMALSGAAPATLISTPIVEVGDA